MNQPTNVTAAQPPATHMPQITPRPAQVKGVASPVMTLNGCWEFSPAKSAPFSPIKVPGEWAMQGFAVTPGTFATYRRNLDLPSDWAGKAIKLRFDAVHAVCKVRINGEEVGGHEGGFVPFELDVSTAVSPGPNELIVEVQSESIADSIACMSQYAAHQVGGIVRKVTLFCLPEFHISELWHETTLSGENALVTVHTILTGSSPNDTLASHRLLDSNNKTVATATGDQPLHVPNAHLWTSETPYLYTLETTIPGATLRQPIGLREIHVSGNQLLINGKPVKLLGVNRHEAHPLTGRSLTPELCHKDAELFRAANVNLVRTSHYPPSEEFLTACDELGIFVECEAAITWIKHHASPVWNEWDHLDSKYLPYLLGANLDNIAASRNHPSVIIWSIANESRWSPLFAEVLTAVKQMDPTRPATFHDQCWGRFNNAGSKADIAVHHYPSDANATRWSKFDRPVWFGEYAHVQCYNRRELVTDPGIRAHWSRPLARMVDRMWQQPGCLGGAIWSGIDDVFHLPNGDLRGYGHWGIIDGWRREKPEYQGVRMAYTPLRILKSNSPLAGPITLRVQNRFNFTDLSDVNLNWQCGEETGKAMIQLAPHEIGEIIIQPKTWALHHKLTLTAIDPRGVMVAKTIFEPESAAQNDASPAGLNVPPPIPMLLPLNGDGGAIGPAGSVLTNEIAPFTPLPSSWEPQITDADNIRRIEGETDDTIANITIQPGKNGGSTVSYELTLKHDINPRQWGLVFTLPLLRYSNMVYQNQWNMAFRQRHRPHPRQCQGLSY
jgi:beta-galactosidase